MDLFSKKKTTARTTKTTAKKATAASPAPAAAPRKRAVVTKKAAAPKVSAEERMRMIEQAAYFRAEKAGFQGDPHEHWVAAEQEVDAILAKKK